ncbi:MAG: hypothetical protein J7647_04355 [Cyanobacteria bacterium SBLK]|nr:hypothetical protein [Cyanobacteria bacterium SBLK]
MSSERIDRQQHSQQSVERKNESRNLSEETPLEVADLTPGAMMDNVMGTLDQNAAAGVPPEFAPAKFYLGKSRNEYEEESDRLVKPRNSLKPSASPPNLPSRRKIPFSSLPGESQPSVQSKAEAFGEIWQPSLQEKAEEAKESEK